VKKEAVLFMNLGSPDSYEVKDVKKYLDEFLMDEKVIDLPYFLRYPLVKGIIIPARAKSSAQKYQSIWTKNGSPLVYHTEKITSIFQERTGIPSYYCMRYANPAPVKVLERINRENPDLKKLFLFLLFPHYAMSSFESAAEHVKSAYSQGDFTFELNIVQPYYKHHAYIQALSQSIKPFLNVEYDRLIFSYHGVPERHIRKSDITHSNCLSTENCCHKPSEAHPKCYKHQVTTTTDLVVKNLNLSSDKFIQTFQSRLGMDKWLGPSTADTLKVLPTMGVKNILVVCPAFVSDCLETLEEINEEGRELFFHHGGESFTMIPCLNSNMEWIQAIEQISGMASIKENMPE
jgi:protoporphyrin/coproporphyrin ferrochelatase